MKHFSAKSSTVKLGHARIIDAQEVLIQAILCINLVFNYKLIYYFFHRVSDLFSEDFFLSTT